MNIYNMRVLFCLSLLLATHCVQAQTDKADVLQNHLKNTVNHYRTSVAEKAYIFSGQEYYHNTGKLIGHRYAGVDAFLESNIWYEGKWYNKVPLKLDILHKELITYTTNENFQLIIQQEKVDSFTLGNMLYWHVKPNENNKKITEDFYEVLYKNKLTVLARRTKQIKENVSSGGVEKKIEQADEYYLLQSGIYTEIKNRSSFLDLLGSQRSTVSSYMNKQDISFNSSTEKYIVEAIKYFEQFIN
ncbi:MAG TPA: hypothetical protein PLW32_07775 [Chitinophagaceae bacterium]|nr:hypothetical protein [Chitinophagaceae bacterium]